MFSALSRSRSMAWTVWIMASVFYAYQYIVRVMPSTMMHDIMQQFGIDASTFGQFSGIYYIGYALIHLPIGILLDRYGPKKIMSACILLTVVGLLPLLFADRWIYPIVGRLLIGVGSSAAILGVFKIIRMTFSDIRFPRMLGLSVTIGLLGAIYGGGPVSYMHQVWGSHTVVQLMAATGVVLAAVTYWLFPNLTSPSQGTVLSDIKEVISNGRVIWSCIFAGLMVGPLEGFADVWGTAFLKQVYGFEGTLAASMPSMIFVGMCFGAPVLSFIADKIGSYSATIIGAGITMVLGISLMIMWHLTSGALSLSFVLVGICCAYQILAIYKVSTYVRQHVAGLTTALANMIIMIFGYVFHAIIGSIVHAMGGPTVSKALIYGVAVIPCALFLGTSGFVLLFLWEKGSERRRVTKMEVERG